MTMKIKISRRKTPAISGNAKKKKKPENCGGGGESKSAD